MIVMPTFSKSQQADNPLVAAQVSRLELALAKGVTDRIDAPGGVAGKKYAYHPSPEQARPAAQEQRDEKRE